MPIIVCFEGRLADTPKLAHTPNDTAVAEAVVLCNRRTKKGEEWVDAEPTRYYILAWKKRAEALAQLSKGASVIIIGHVETESWINGAGEKKYTDTVIVDAIGESLPLPLLTESSGTVQRPGS
jgi:single-stranded DNA-binding protein